MSVRDYYYEISHGKLSIEGDSNSISDWVLADHDYDYYCDGVQGTGQGNGQNGGPAAGGPVGGSGFAGGHHF